MKPLLIVLGSWAIALPLGATGCASPTPSTQRSTSRDPESIAVGEPWLAVEGRLLAAGANETAIAASSEKHYELPDGRVLLIDLDGKGETVAEIEVVAGTHLAKRERRTLQVQRFELP